MNTWSGRTPWREAASPKWTRGVGEHSEGLAVDRVEPNPQIREILVAVQAVLRDAYASGKYGEWRVAGTFEPQTFGRTKGGCEFSLTSGRKRTTK